MTTYNLQLIVFAALLLPFITAQDKGCETSPKPDFKAPGRRISEEKCYEYNWERKNLDKCSKEPANIEHPYMGMMGYDSEGKLSFRCAAFLVSPKFALTGAHCINLPANIKLTGPKIVRFGNSDIASDDAPRVDVKVLKTYVHEKYAPPKKAFDIALVELEEALPLTKSIQPVCLWTKSSLEDITYGDAPGWGTDGNTSAISDTLRVMKVQLLDTKTCEPFVKHLFNRNWPEIQEDQVCGDESKSTVRMCKGSAGVPLVTSGKLDGGDEMPHAFAVTSFGFTCNQKQQIGVYTRISTFIDWIENIVWPSA